MITRAKLEALVWKHTHRDFRGSIDGARNILRNAGGGRGTCLAFLSSLTEAELFAALPARVRLELEGGKEKIEK